MQARGPSGPHGGPDGVAPLLGRARWRGAVLHPVLPKAVRAAVVAGALADVLAQADDALHGRLLNTQLAARAAAWLR